MSSPGLGLDKVGSDYSSTYNMLLEAIATLISLNNSKLKQKISAKIHSFYDLVDVLALNMQAVVVVVVVRGHG